MSGGRLLAQRGRSFVGVSEYITFQRATLADMRKQIGMVDAGLLAEVDDRARLLGQTRRVFVERALESALTSNDAYLHATGQADRIPPSVPRASGAMPNRADAFRQSTQGKRRK